MRVNDANTMPKDNMLQDQVAKQGGLAGAGFTDDINMLTLINRGNAKGLGITPAETLADCNGLVIHGARTSLHSCRWPNPVAVIYGGVTSAEVLCGTPTR